MAASKKDITIEAYAGFFLDVACLDANAQPVPLTGYTAVAEVRAKYADTDALAVFIPGIDEPGGIVHLEMPKEETGKLQNTKLAYWDLFITAPGGQPVRLVQGQVTVSPAASRT